MAIYVDGIIVGSNKEEREGVIRKFETKNENESLSFLGLEVIRDNNSIKLIVLKRF